MPVKTIMAHLHELLNHKIKYISVNKQLCEYTGVSTQ